MVDNWKHKSARMKCKTCMWFIAKSKDVGRCRKHSPSLEGYPVVFETDWCGDHKLDDESKEE